MRKLILAAAFAGLSWASGVIAQPASDPGQSAVETGLLAAVAFDGQAETWTIAGRMARWSTPGVSVAVVDDGRIVWAQGYGVLAAGDDAPVTTDTRFQAASISKPVAATAALSLVQDGRLSVDGDINQALRSWTLPDSAFTAERRLQLRDLLSHTGGTTVHGFPGYAQGTTVPSLVQVLNGTAPANTAAIVSERAPGEAWKYSGGGYQIVQQLMEDVTGRPFAEIVAERVLVPASMANSGYAAPAPGDFALGHGSDGRPIAGGWHTYPEQAAAGLWTTPSDLARFGLALAAAWRGEDDAVLDHPTATLMMTPVKGDYGLGPGVRGEGAALAISHGGSNEGYQAFWVMHPQTGDGVAVMTNGDGGNGVAMEIVRAVAKAYDWPDYAPAARQAFALPPEVLAGRAGVWSTDLDGERISVTASPQGIRLLLDTFRGPYLFTAVSATAMVAAETGTSATFAVREDGVQTFRAFGLEFTKSVP